MRTSRIGTLKDNKQDYPRGFQYSTADMLEVDPLAEAKDILYQKSRPKKHKRKTKTFKVI